MKKLLVYLTLIVTFFLPMNTVSAQGLCPPGSDQTNGADYGLLCRNGANSNAVGNFIGRAILVVFVVAVIVALFFLIWGGFKWLTSGGDSKQVDAARGHIIAAIIGLIIIFLSYFILAVVVPIFVPGFNFQKFTIPTIVAP